MKFNRCLAVCAWTTRATLVSDDGRITKLPGIPTASLQESVAQLCDSLRAGQAILEDGPPKYT